MTIRWFSLFACAIVGIFSCQLNRSDSSDAKSSWFGGLSFLGNGKSKIPIYMDVFAFDGGVSGNSPAQALVKIDATICDKKGEEPSNKIYEKWIIPVNSPFGTSDVMLEIPRFEQGNNEIRVTVDDQRYFLSSPFVLDDQTAMVACRKHQEEQLIRLPEKHELEAQLSALLQSLAPDCDFDFQKNSGWQCQFNPVSPQTALNELTDLRNIMIRRWSRLPYILMRRITISQQLGRLLKDGAAKFKDSLALCTIVKHSLAEELPLVMTTKRWQDAVCSGPATSESYQAAAVGLSKALSEIEVLRQLFQKASKLGLLRFKLENVETTVSKDFWVSLTPGDDVAENLVNISKAIAASNAESNQETGCWHPIFGQEPDKLDLAKQLDLVGTSSRSHCRASDDAAEERLGANPHLYFADSVTSEAEFVVTNGNGKLLRLPQGSYKVAIRYHLSTAADWDHEPPLVGTTNIDWVNRRPSILIKEITKP